MTDARAGADSKVQEVTLLFWVLKIAATTHGETGGDALLAFMVAGIAVFPQRPASKSH